MSHIVGYQVRNESGTIWGDRQAREILTAETAISDVRTANKESGADWWFMVVVLDGDIKSPMYEKPLMNTDDQYRVLCASTAHLSESDRKAINLLAFDTDCNMIAGRDTGWFVKLYDEVDPCLRYEGMSDTFHGILDAALLSGYRMVEFDSDGTTHDELDIAW